MKSVGVYRYSPTLNGSMQRRDGGSTRWWLIIECDPELGRYLRHQFLLAVHRTAKPQAPLWGTHISVIRDEEPSDKTRWELYNGQQVEFEYDPEIHHTGGYLWVAVQCEAALRHREELGLPREPIPPLHLTIGNLKMDEEG